MKKRKNKKAKRNITTMKRIRTKTKTTTFHINQEAAATDIEDRVTTDTEEEAATYPDNICNTTIERGKKHTKKQTPIKQQQPTTEGR